MARFERYPSPGVTRRSRAAILVSDTDLPNQLQCELDLPSRRRDLIDRACARDWSSALVKERAIVDRHCEVGSIENVEELHPKLRIECLRDFRDIVVLKERQIKIHESRPNHAVATRVSQKVRAAARNSRKRHALSSQRSRCHRNRETAEVDVVVYVARIYC